MCGIFGIILKEGQVAPIIHSSLRMLEYRGYDSAGEATIENGKLHVKKDAGKISNIHKRLNLDDLPGRVGLGHTRWATHGAPFQINAHPHLDCKNQLAIVHNGIIENYELLKKDLEDRRHIFNSKTDSETIAHLIEAYLVQGVTFTDAFREAVKKLEGTYAVAAIYSKEPDKILTARKESPLLIGLSDRGCALSSDIPALLPFTHNILDVKNGEMAILTPEDLEIRGIEDWTLKSRSATTITWNVENAKKSGFPHFMLKEIHEQPLTLTNAFLVQEKYLNLIATFLDRSKEIFLLASGTSHHSCIAASYILSQTARIPAYPIHASEFIEHFGDSVNVDSTVLAVSQSGETADVLKAVDHARLHAATVIGLTNVLGSTLTRVTRAYLCQNSWPEIGVAATKTFTAQIMVLSRLALKLAKSRGKISQDEIDELDERLREIPRLAERVLATQEGKMKRLAKKYRNKQTFYYLGRGVSVATAYEGRLKLLEIAYIPSIAYPAGESKHGPISLIEEGFPVIFTVPKGRTRRTTVGNIMEMKARGATTIGVIEEGDRELIEILDDHAEIPGGVPEIFSPMLYVIPLQLFAYYLAVERGLDPDKPRNLAKSVTVL